MCLRRRLSASEKSLDDIKRYRDQKNRDARCGDHSADDGRAKHAPGDGAGAAGKPKRQTSEDKCERSHEDRSQAQTRALKRGVDEWFAFFVFVLGEFDDKDRVFSGQSDEHDETDLRVDVVLHPAQPKRRERAEHRDRRAEQHTEWQRPAFVQRSQDQENENKRHSEHHSGRYALLRLFLLK